VPRVDTSRTVVTIRYMKPAPREPTVDREVRLGLVLYGGISLAVYMCGVTRELFDAARGGRVYGLAKALLGSDIVVDVVSGTSAGGINGVLLAYCLANRKDFADFGELWRVQADLDRLLRKSGDPAPPSLLDSPYFQQRLEAALAGLGELQPEAMRVGERSCPLASGSFPIDVFVTATDYHGVIAERLDLEGARIAVKDHRRVFRLKHRPGRDQDDLESPNGGEALHQQAIATVCRATASFPAAFAPTEIPAAPPAGDTRDPGSAAALLHRWLGSRDGARALLVDGGVLDNKPFLHTLGAIYRRTAHREVARHMVYVEPDPETLRALQAADPTAVDVAAAALVRLPSYESIADDLRSLDDHNRRVARYHEMAGRVSPPAILLRALAAEAVGPDPGHVVHLRARLADLRDRLVELLQAAAPAAPLDRVASVTTAVKDSFGSLMGEGDGGDTGDVSPGAEPLLGRIDVAFRLRRLFHVTYWLYDRIYPPARNGSLPDPGGMALLAGLNRYIQLLVSLEHREAKWVEGWAERAVASGFDPLADLDAFWIAPPALAASLAEKSAALVNFAVEPSLEASLESAGPLSDAEIADLLAQTGSAAAAEPGPPLLALVDAAVEELLGAIPGPTSDGPGLGAPATACEVYDRFLAIDAALFPAETLSDLRAKDHIDVVRVSPLDATSAWAPDLSLAEKMAGETLGHFGAFLKRSWRSNDLLWGRLDAAAKLLRVLLVQGKDRVAEVAASSARRDAARREIAAITTGPGTPFSAAAAIDAFFPRLAGVDPNARETLVWWLNGMGGEATAMREERSADETVATATPEQLTSENNVALATPDLVSVEDAVALLTKAAHLEIIATDFPQVVRDAQQDLREARVGSPRRDGTVENEVFQAAAAECIDQVLGAAGGKGGETPPEDPARTKAVLALFRRARVGRETPASLAVPILLGLVGRAVAVGERVVSGALRSRLPPILRAVVAPVSVAVRAAALFVTLLAQGARVWVVWFVLRIASWVLLVVGITHPRLWFSNGTVSIVGAVVFLVAPLAVVLLDALLFVGGAYRAAGRLALSLEVPVIALLARFGAYDRLWSCLGALRPSGLLEWLGLTLPLALAAAWLLLRRFPVWRTRG
jgi:patatin-related protein